MFTHLYTHMLFKLTSFRVRVFVKIRFFYKNYLEIIFILKNQKTQIL